MSPPDGAEAIRQIVAMAEMIGWPDPEPLFEPEETERPYPLEALPRVMADAIREYQVYGQQPLALVAGSALATASLAVQGLVDVARDRHLTGPVSLHIVTIAISGERKTSADRAFNRPIRAWLRDRREALQPAVDKARAEHLAWQAERDGLVNKIKAAAGGQGKAEADFTRYKRRLAELEARAPHQPILPSLFYEDTNAARLAVDLAEGWPSASIWSDEAGLVVGSHGMNNDNLMAFIGLLNRLWDGQDFDRNRLTVKSAQIKGRRLTVSLMMQPVVLARLLAAGGGASRGMGWIAPNLIACPSSSIGSRPYRDSTEMPALDTLHCRVRELLDLELPVKDAGMVLAPPALTLSPPAFRIWHPFHDDVEAQLSRFGEFGSVPDIGAKIAENAARIAAVLHVITQGPGGSISAETMEAGAAVAIWHLNEARRIVGATKIPQDVADADLLLQWLLRRAESTIEPRDILRLAPAPLRVKERRDAAINILLAKHWVRFANVGGADRLVLNPKARG